MAPTQLLRALANTPSNGVSAEDLARFGAHLGIRHVFGASSGRASLWWILRSLQRMRPDAKIVAMPAYTCFSVAAAVVRAGLTLHLLDIEPNNLDFDRKQLENLPEKGLLCIITSNLFGFVNNPGPLLTAARARNAFLVDDAAQAFGATRDGRLAGTTADVGFYSLGRGKALTTMQGGLIVTNRGDIARAIQEESAEIAPCAWLNGPWLLLQLLVYSVFLRPGLYRIPKSLPFLRLGATEFNPRFATRQLHPLSCSLLLVLLDSLGRMNEVRRTNARSVTESLKGHPRLHVPSPGPRTQPTMIRLPVIAKDENTQRHALESLRRAGVDASGFYPSSICDIEGICEYMSSPRFHRVQAEHLAHTLFTVPVNPLVEHRDLERIIEVLHGV